MPHSPALDRFLAAMEYPALRDDLVREAVRDGLGPDDRAVLENLPEQSFSAAWQVRYALARRSIAEAFAPREPVPA